MNKSATRGFTLIELMITMAIISLIAAVAVPSYTDYVRKTTVAEGYGLMQEVKASVSAEYSATGEFPSSVQSFNPDNSGDADAKFSALFWHHGNSVTNGGIIEVQFGPGSGDELNGKRLWLKPDASNGFSITWSCHTHYISRRAIPDEYLPSDCTAWER